jgi:hypothetical protein
MEKMMKLVMGIIICWVLAGFIFGESSQLKGDTIILSKEDDPFYPLAIEISKHENIPVVHTVDEVLGKGKEFLLWVISPDFLSDEVIMSFSEKMKYSRNFPSTGIISGANIETAKALYYRGRCRIEKNSGENLQYISVAYADNYKLLLSRENQIKEIPFTKTNLINIFPTLNVFFYWGHGGSNYFKIKKSEKLIPREIPGLPGSIIKAGSCNSFRIWRGQSMALQFIEKGADAFFGYSYSPAPFYMFGYFEAPPLINSFKQVPLGHLVHLQNRADLKGFVRIPFLFLLGDPRIFLQPQTPYTLINDREDADDSSRILKYRSMVKGFLPVYIPGGAKYDFLKIEFPEVEKKNAYTYYYWEDSPWYHSKIQTLNFHQDKLILFKLCGEEFLVKLTNKPSSSAFFLSHTLLNGLDYSFIFCMQTGGNLISCLFILILVVCLIVSYKKNSLPGLKASLVKGIIAGTIFSLLLLLYTSIRVKHMTIISNAHDFSWITIIAGFFLTALSTALFFRVSKLWKKIISFSFLVSPVLITLIVWTFSILFGNIIVMVHIKKGIYNSSVLYLSLITLTVEIVFFTFLYFFFKRVDISPFFKR